MAQASSEHERVILKGTRWLLLKNPELVKRHEVDASQTSESGVMDGVFAKLKSMTKLWAST